MNAITITASRMSPYASSSVTAMLAGDDSSSTLHGARREIAAYADRLVGRNRSPQHSKARAIQIATAQEAYDAIAAKLVARGEL